MIDNSNKILNPYSGRGLRIRFLILIFYLLINTFLGLLVNKFSFYILLFIIFIFFSILIFQKEIWLWPVSVRLENEGVLLSFRISRQLLFLWSNMEYWSLYIYGGRDEHIGIWVRGKNKAYFFDKRVGENIKVHYFDKMGKNLPEKVLR